MIRIHLFIQDDRDSPLKFYWFLSDRKGGSYHEAQTSHVIWNHPWGRITVVGFRWALRGQDESPARSRESSELRL